MSPGRAGKARAGLAGRSPLKREPPGADLLGMGRSVIGLCAVVGSFVGGALPALWGDSGLSLAGVLCGALGGIAGVWAGVRVSDV